MESDHFNGYIEVEVEVEVEVAVGKALHDLNSNTKTRLSDQFLYEMDQNSWRYDGLCVCKKLDLTCYA